MVILACIIGGITFLIMMACFFDLFCEEYIGVAPPFKNYLRKLFKAPPKEAPRW